MIRVRPTHSIRGPGGAGGEDSVGGRVPGPRGGVLSRTRTFECGLCGYSRKLTPDDKARVYEEPWDFSVIEWPCWCWNCDAATLAEKIPGLAEIVENSRAWKRRDREFNYFSCRPCSAKPYDDEREEGAMAYFDLLFEWRKGRRSAGKCLECGSPFIGVAAEQFGKFEHPHCGGMIQFHWCFGSSAVRSFPVEVFSTEGDKLYDAMYYY